MVIPLLSAFGLLTLLGPAASSEDLIDENPVAEYNPTFNLTREKRQYDYDYKNDNDYDYNYGIGRQKLYSSSIFVFQGVSNADFYLHRTETTGLRS